MANQRKEQTGKVEKYINWLQRSERCHWQYGSTFIRLAVVAPQVCEILRNSPKIRTYSSSRTYHPRSSILVPIKSAYAISYSSLIVTLDAAPTVFEILTHFAQT